LEAALPDKTPSFWEWIFSHSGQVMLAGLAGAAVNAILEWGGVLSALRKLVIGFLCSIYLGPLGLPILEWSFSKAAIPTEQAPLAAGFTMGLCGLFVVEVIYRTVKARRDAVQGGNDAPNAG
jgi:hypothetical protein